jgi:hypothetical protein
LEDFPTVQEGFEHFDLVGGLVPSEADQIGTVAGIESTLAGAYSAHSGWIAGGQRYGVAQAEARGSHHIRYGMVHSQGGAGQARCAC